MGLILPQRVTICFTGKQKQHLESLGYEPVPYLTNIEIDVLDLFPKSNIIVRAICDYCGEEFQAPYERITHAKISKVKMVSCNNCKRRKYSDQKVLDVISNGKINPLYWDKNWLEEQYVTKGITADEIAKLCNVNVRTIRSYIKEFNIVKWRNPDDYLTEEFLTIEYCEKMKSISEIHLDTGFSTSCISNRLSRYGISVRTQSEFMEHYYESDDNRALQSTNSKKMWKSSKFRKKHKESMHKAQSDPEYRKRVSARMRGIPIEDWDGFVGSENRLARGTYQYDEWRNAIYRRDDYTCQCCGARSKKDSPVSLNAHHINNFSTNYELRFNIDNGITLCDSCHSMDNEGSFHRLYGTRNNTREQLDEYIRNRRAELTV